ncbi:family 16 glycosylhydrolase [Aliarcobacter butzleri]|jgi:GR25 family glycosyltransferase involved in LPS biosynthesis
MHIITGNKFLRKLKQFFKYIYRFTFRNEKLNVFEKNSETLISKVYLINLDRQKDRLNRFNKEIRRLKLHNGISLGNFYERFSAIDGKNLDLNISDEFVAKKYPLTAQYYVDPDPRLLDIIKNKNIDVELFPEEIAVAISHINIWQKIVEEKISYTLILEDDVFFEKYFSEKLNDLWDELVNREKDGYKFDILYLSYQEVNHGPINMIYSNNLKKLHRGYWWLSGYILSYPAAKFLLDNLPVIGPIDLWLNNFFNVLDVYAVNNPIISQRKDLNSDNRYSILPILSQVGIQSDKTHLLLEEKKGKYPVFCIGYNDYDSEIFEIILSICGYRCCNDKVRSLSKVYEKYILNNTPLLFDAYINLESFDNNVNILSKLYGNAMFIISSNYKYKYSLSKDRYIIFDINSATSWKDICHFLKCKVPSVKFPLNQKINKLKFEPNKNIYNITSNKKVLRHDVNPWIIPYERLAEYGIHTMQEIPLLSKDIKNIILEFFDSFDEDIWNPLTNTFPTNITYFKKENINIVQNKCLLNLKKERYKFKDYTAASFSSKHCFLFGRFEINMKVSKAEGIVSAFFLHRNDPWQEIDIEILGNDTSKLLTNVYFNPGINGTGLNYGNRGTPILIDLGFDASEDYHSYAIEWEPYEIRWYVDNKLIHKRILWEPTPIPNQPMKLFCSIWSSESNDLAGILNENNLPQVNEIKSISIEEWI